MGCRGKRDRPCIQPHLQGDDLDHRRRQAYEEDSQGKHTTESRQRF